MLMISAAPAARCAGSYLDVPEGHWAEPYIESARQYGIMEGMERACSVGTDPDPGPVRRPPAEVLRLDAGGVRRAALQRCVGRRLVLP